MEEGWKSPVSAIFLWGYDDDDEMMKMVAYDNTVNKNSNSSNNNDNKNC